MRVLLAFDKFKDSLDARAACEIVAKALRGRHRDWTLDLCPLADGGEGFAEILTRAIDGELIQQPVSGPRGEKVQAAFGLVQFSKIPSAARAVFEIENQDSKFGNSPIAIVEMATASGLALLPSEARDPWQTTTLGTGELIAAAARAGAGAIVLGVGGSATNDLGLGALAALGLEFRSATGERVHPPIPARWKEIAEMSGAVVAGLPPIFIACDVTNPLLGRRGAAAVYGPQKGLRAEDLTRLEHASARVALMLSAHCAQPDTLMDAAGTGAAGGLPFGLMAATNARLLPGFEFVSAWLDLDSRLAAAELVLTGEGRFDDSSLSGKGPGAVAARALAFGLPVHVFAGAVTAKHARPGLSLHAITPPDVPLPEALREAEKNLTAAVESAF